MSDHGCCSGEAPAVDRQLHAAPAAHNARGNFIRVSGAWTTADRRGQVKCRLSNRFRMRYSVGPGLYALGQPSPDSPVLVTANYKLSFDLLRRALAGTDAWILVLDTKGINVWCAAGKGSFGTRELVSRILHSNLAGHISHRRLILPQLGAPGVSAHQVKRESGFSVSYGPVHARDLPEYLRSGRKASAEMRTIRFPLRDRLVLTPMELNTAFKKLPAYALALFIYFGLSPAGLLFAPALAGGLPFLVLGILTVLAGGFFTPLLLPLIPFRSFALKGWLMGLVCSGLFLLLAPGIRAGNPWLPALTLVFFPAVSSYLGFNFTGCTPFTSLSGVKKELRIALPLYLSAGIVSLALMVLVKLNLWGIV
jgi:hypothetical protein